ncbi:unnamed protein product [Pleuronectes platessa]|uniref:Uncharacterized protein n=1 Tax=Pleuronectes platessa TaxID=8262 RepID=A0A9N7UFQ9_PLEPL|nr:unnamed protein product [Pleuronectes platessa]
MAPSSLERDMSQCVGASVRVNRVEEEGRVLPSHNSHVTGAVQVRHCGFWECSPPDAGPIQLLQTVEAGSCD